MNNYKTNIISPYSTLKEAMEKLNDFPTGSTLFVIDESNQKVVGTVTDGDIRRGLLKNITIDNKIELIMQTKFKYLSPGNYYNDLVNEYKAFKIKTLPLLDDQQRLVKLYDLTELKNILPIHAVIMAGGRGERLKPLTDNLPKPLLKIGRKPIIEHNIDRLKLNGVDSFFISVNYLGEMIKEYFKDGGSRNTKINYIEETQPLGTIGSVANITNLEHENILLMNSDLLTNIDFADFYKFFIINDADIAVATIPYKVRVPYAVFETKNNFVTGLKEKPTYSYYSNAGIYLIKKNLLSKIPKDIFYNATDFIERVIEDKGKVMTYEILGYWLDIGKHDDYNKALQDIDHLDLS